MIKIFDCTLRDGGYVNDWFFSDEQVLACYNADSLANVDYCEIGFKRTKNENEMKKYGKWFFCDEEVINKVIPTKTNCKIAVMSQIGTFDISDFIPKNKSKIDMVRVLLAYHGFNKCTDDKIDEESLNKGILQMQQLIDLGYEVTFNIGRIDKLSDEQIDYICDKIKNLKILYLYLADTYSHLNIYDTRKKVAYIKNLLQNKYKTNIGLGFHAHNSMNDATSKALIALEHGADIIDGTMSGYGRGSGNAYLELILINLNREYKCKYNFEEIIKCSNIYFKNYKKYVNDCEYNLIYVICAFNGAHVNYAIELIEKTNELDINDILIIFQEIKNNHKNMFYYDDLIKNIIKNKNIKFINNLI